MKFQLDRLGQPDAAQIDNEFNSIKQKASNQKLLYGVFGYIKLEKFSYLILIEEASIVGQVLKGAIYKVEKLMYIPIASNQNDVHSEDR